MSAQEMNHGGRFHMDDRGIRYCDIFPEIEKGDINISIIEPGAAALWHRHTHQDDYQLVVKGSLKVGVFNAPYMDNDDLKSYGMSEDDIATVYENREDLLKGWQALLSSLDEVTAESDRELIEKIKPYLSEWPESEGKVEWHYLSERNAKDGPLFIPRFLWHGCYNYTNEPATLIYHITNKYNGQDEHRLDPIVAGWNYKRVIK